MCRTAVVVTVVRGLAGQGRGGGAAGWYTASGASGSLGRARDEGRHSWQDVGGWGGVGVVTACCPLHSTLPCPNPGRRLPPTRTHTMSCLELPPPAPTRAELHEPMEAARPGDGDVVAALDVERRVRVVPEGPRHGKVRPCNAGMPRVLVLQLCIAAVHAGGARQRHEGYMQLLRHMACDGRAVGGRFFEPLWPKPRLTDTTDARVSRGIKTALWTHTTHTPTASARTVRPCTCALADKPTSS